MRTEKKKLPEAEFLAVLKRTGLFNGLEEHELQRVRSLLHQKFVPAGMDFMQEGEQDSSVFVLLDGTVKVHIEREKGSGVILAICGSGEILGDIGALDGQGRSASVGAMEDCVLAVFYGTDFLECLNSMPRLSLNLAFNASRRLRAATAQIQSLARRDVSGRVAAQLLLFATQYGQPVHDVRAPNHRATDVGLSFRQSDLADLIGASRVAVNQALSAYRRLGALDIKNGRFVILDQSMLERRR